MQSAAPIARDLVLLGGGHAHVSVLKSFGMRPIDGVRVTLINRDVDTPYSGMLPGLIAGHYTFDETHIDLGRLCRYADVRFIHDEVIGIDPERRLLMFRQRPPLAYDLLSIDTGSTPNLRDVPGAAEHTVPVKPISNFLARWEALRARALEHRGPMRIGVAGAGAGGVELLLAVQYRLAALREEHGISEPLSFDLFSAAETPLPSFDEAVRRKFARILDERRIAVHCGRRVARVEKGALILDHDVRFEADEILWVTDASAPDWIAQGGLAVDDRGFTMVDSTLRSLSHDSIFAAGDVAHVDQYPRPKAGVFAVRQGKPLTDNLRRALLGETLMPFRPQDEFLKLISTGDQYAVASRNGLALEGSWVWRWKDAIDRRFMAKFNDLPPMLSGSVRKPFARLPDDVIPPLEAMRCGGCGAKIAAATLAEALRDLQPVANAEVVAGLDAPDDAAIVRPPAGKALLQTVDSFRAMVEDPYLFGKVAAMHALNDVYAMGGTPQTAMAIVTLPYSAPDIAARDLRHMMAGAVDALNEAGAALVGGHSGEGAETALGFAVTGAIDEDRALRKSGLKPGDALILTKPLGTGVLFAADMQYRAHGRWIYAAIASMLQSHAAAAQCFLDHGAHSATDITGFGIAGHLGEMARASNLTITIDQQALPVLEGAVEMFEAGYASSLQPANAQFGAGLFDAGEAARLAACPILFDPQTSGGLVAGIGADRAEACLQALRLAGYREARIIGWTSPFGGSSLRLGAGGQSGAAHS